MKLPDPPLTAVEERELADMNEEGERAARQVIRRRFYMEMFLFSSLAFLLELAAWHSFTGVGTLLVLLIAVAYRKAPHNRSTDYGALSRGRMEERDPPQYMTLEQRYERNKEKIES